MCVPLQPCEVLITCWERADLLALLYVMFSCVFVTLPPGLANWSTRLNIATNMLCAAEKVLLLL